MTMTGSRPRAALLALHIVFMGTFAAPAPSAAMQILDAADHAELAAQISATGVNRIALAGDRIAKAVRAPDGFAVEHDAASGDLYLRPVAAQPAEHDPVTLFVGTEKGFTYRLTLTPSDRDSAQILIRNVEAAPGAGETAVAAQTTKSDPYVAALVGLVRAVARRKTLPGYAIQAGGDPVLRHSAPGLTLIETWRGPRLAAHVLETDRDASDAADFAGTIARSVGSLPGVGRVAALWQAGPGTGPSGGRLVVAVTEAAGGPQ